MREKILMISNVTGGLVNFRRELLERLCPEYDVTVLASENIGRDIIEGLGCKFINTDFDRHGTNPVKEAGLYFKYKKLIRSIAPKIVLTYTIKPNIYAGAACASLGIPYIVNVTGLGAAVENPGMLQKISIPMYRFGIRKAQKVFFQNAENQKFMLDHKMISGLYDLLPGSGVNLDRFPLLEYPQGKEIHFVFISRVIKEKGIDQFIDAAKVIRKKYPFTRFHVCGNCEQEYEEMLKELQTNDVLIYHGRVNDIPGIHKFSSCTIHPTYYPEGMSNVLLESAACGRPIITTRRAGCREIVDDGVNGFLIHERNSQDLIDAVERFLTLSWEQRKEMGIAGRKKVEAEFDRKIVITKYLNEIQLN